MGVFRGIIYAIAPALALWAVLFGFFAAMVWTLV